MNRQQRRKLQKAFKNKKNLKNLFKRNKNFAIFKIHEKVILNYDKIMKNYSQYSRTFLEFVETYKNKPLEVVEYWDNEYFDYLKLKEDDRWMIHESEVLKYEGDEKVE